MVGLLVLWLSLIHMTVTASTSNTNTCQKYSTLRCLLALEELTTLIPNSTLGILQLPYVENDRNYTRVCQLFGKYETCISKLQIDGNCSVTGYLDMLARAFSDTMCDPYLVKTVRPLQKTCLGKVWTPAANANCQSRPNWSLELLLTLMDDDDKKAHINFCEEAESIQSYVICMTSDMFSLCRDTAAPQLANYFRTHARDMVTGSDCQTLLAAEGLKEPVYPSANDKVANTCWLCSSSEHTCHPINGDQCFQQIHSGAAVYPDPEKCHTACQPNERPSPTKTMNNGSCEALSTALCLLDLTDIRKINPTMSMNVFARLVLPDQRKKHTAICKTMAKYKDCVKDVEKEGNCKVTSYADKLLASMADFGCSNDLLEIIDKNEACFRKLIYSEEYINCGKSFDDIISLSRITKLVVDNSREIFCDLVNGLSNYKTCSNRVAAGMCPNSKEMIDYVQNTIGLFVADSYISHCRQPVPNILDIGPWNPGEGEVDIAKSRYMSLHCDSSQTEHAERCLWLFDSMGADILSIVNDTPNLYRRLRRFYRPFCGENYYGAFHTCINQQFLSKPASKCAIYSCFLTRIAAGCQHIDVISKKLYNCVYPLFTTDKKVLSCLAKALVKYKRQPIGNHRDIWIDWSAAIPELYACVKEPIASKCGQPAIDLLGILAAPFLHESSGNCSTIRNLIPTSVTPSIPWSKKKGDFDTDDDPVALAQDSPHGNASRTIFAPYLMLALVVLCGVQSIVP